jgi:hypothetical protein
MKAGDILIKYIKDYEGMSEHERQVIHDLFIALGEDMDRKIIEAMMHTNPQESGEVET